MGRATALRCILGRLAKLKPVECGAVDNAVVRRRPGKQAAAAVTAAPRSEVLWLDAVDDV